ncbi:MAG TPA: xanthine dehydrogenase family protein molybdopterin-binding subunit [Chloroflexota bacterium]|nr:xanthine dehydrogenase family protein molybdopterin-binding subunit [Chloroflexota bacterium]
MSSPAPRYLGAPLPRREDPRFLRGHATFLADLHLPHQLYAAFLRSPLPHARLRHLDLAPARRAPGVVAAFAFSDLAPYAKPIPLLVPHPALRPATPFPLAPDTVRFVGEPVALVVATDPYRAEDALALIDVAYDPLPPLPTPTQATAPTAPRLHPALPDNRAATLRHGFGDLPAAFAQAARVVEATFRLGRVSGQPLEPRGCLAVWEPSKLGPTLTLWDATQSPHTARRLLAALFELPLHAVRVIAPDIGGGFGIKNRFYPEEAAVPIAARLLERPVKWVEDRREDLLTTYQERAQEHRAALALGREGTLLGVRDTVVADQGAYTPFGLVVPYNTTTTLPGPYRLGAYEAALEVVYTTKPAVAPYRAAGRPQAVFVMERLLDLGARALGWDPAELRLRNLIQPHEFPFDRGLRDRDGTPIIYDSGDYPAALRKALELVDYTGFRAEQAAARARGRYLGIGLGCYVEPTGGGPFEGATVRVEPSGRVFVATGACSQGQGHETTLAQLCAARLGVRVEDVVVLTGDTAAIPLGAGTYASRSGVTAGNAVSRAALLVREKALRVAAQLLEAAPADLELVEGRIFVRGAPERSLPLGEVARVLTAPPPAYLFPPDLEPGLEATTYYHPEGNVYSYGTHAAVVEVDVETGVVQVLRYVVAHDCGVVVNPLVAEGQIHGGVVQGIGMALYEEMVYDEYGQPLTTSYMDYLLPTAMEVPPITIGHLETPSPLNPEGIKGLGEGGTMPVPAAIANAVEDALAPFGVRVTELPLTPERVLALLERARSEGQGGR